MADNAVVLDDGSICERSLYELRYSRGNSRESSKEIRDRRLECERDVGRIRYSASLLRLSGVSQVTTPDPQVLRRHDRLTHTLKVAGLAREIANDLVREAISPEGEGSEALRIILAYGGLDVSACEAGGLGHDLGHAPFAHTSQKILDSWLSEVGDSCGFEGNAQSIRVVTRLEPRKTEVAGLGLTAVTLGAMQKYPWTRDRSIDKRCHKFSVYLQDAEALELGQQCLPEPLRDNRQMHENRQTLEAAIVELADDITYAVHDVQDFVEAGILDFAGIARDVGSISGVLCNSDTPFNPHSVTGKDHRFLNMAADLAIKHPSIFDAHLLGSHFMSIQTWMEKIDFSWDDTYDSIAKLRESFSNVIATILDGVKVYDPYEKAESAILPSKSGWNYLQAMKLIGRYYAIESPAVARQEKSNQSALSALLDTLLDWAISSREHSLPRPLNEYVAQIDQPLPRDDGPELRRAIVDFVCGLTDNLCLTMAAELCGWRTPTVSSRF